MIVIYCTNIVIDIYYRGMICLFNMLLNSLTLNTQITLSRPIKNIVEENSQSHKHFNGMGDYNSPRQWSTGPREVTWFSLLFPPLLLLINQKIYNHEPFQFSQPIQILPRRIIITHHTKVLVRLGK